jgi:UDPglucose 6-dehydrogenase
MALGTSRMKVAVVGAGYVGLASALAAAHIGHDVRVVETDPRRVSLLRGGVDPLDEPLVADVLAMHPLLFTDDPRVALAAADVVVVAVGTPLLPTGSADLSAVNAAAAAIAAQAPRTTVLVRSTVPVGTAERLQDGLLRSAKVVSNPEFLREGSALRDALTPERVVAGGEASSRSIVEDLYGPVLRQEFAPIADIAPRAASVPLCWMDARSAELTKYAANAFLATKISYVNEIANIAGVVGADIRAITQALGLDSRIAPAYLRPGIGWGGACFPKDVRALQAFAADEGYDFTVLRAVIEQNNQQLRRFFALIQDEFPALADVRIALLGLAFKSQTSDCRESPAVALANLMASRGWQVSAYDPGVHARVPELDERVRIASTPFSAAIGADALVVATEWPEFATLDYRYLRRLMRGDVLFDGRCLLDPQTCTDAGLRYLGICGVPLTEADKSNGILEAYTTALYAAPTRP